MELIVTPSSPNFKNKQHKQPGLAIQRRARVLGTREDEITEGFLEEVGLSYKVSNKEQEQARDGR